MVSLTAANTNRMFDVSVACVRLARQVVSTTKFVICVPRIPWNSLGVQVEMCPVHLVESPKQVLGGLVDIVATGIIGKVVSER